MPAVTREVPFRGGTIWLTIVGTQHAAPTLLVVPGGPGLPHDYLSPLAALSTERPVAFYDPIGTGRSTRMALPWSRALLAEELATVRDHLGDAPIDIYLHSAAVLEADDLWTRPDRYRRVVFASTPFDIPAYMEGVQACIDRLPPKLVEALRAGEADPAKQRSPLYGQAYYQYSREHILRTSIVPAPMQRASLGFNRDILLAVKGGMLIHRMECVTWSIVDRLPALALPVLISWGRHDAYGPERIAAISTGLPDRRLAIFEASSHMPHLEETEAHLEVLRDFLR